MHYVSATVFFLLIATTVWLCAGDTLSQIPNPKIRRLWSRIYQIFAIAMVAAPAAAFVLSDRHQRTIWIETLGVWVFSGFWFAKTYELARVSEVEPRIGPAPSVRRIAGRLEIVRKPDTKPDNFSDQSKRPPDKDPAG